MAASSATLRGPCLNGERVQALGELAGQRPVDHPMGLDAALAAERLGGDFDAKMGLAAGSVADMTGVKMRFVIDLERGRKKSIG